MKNELSGTYRDNTRQKIVVRWMGEDNYLFGYGPMGLWITAAEVIEKLNLLGAKKVK